MLHLCSMARLTKDRWLEEGVKILSEFAQNRLRILYLCERLGVTRGSFYHHFDSIEDYINALMEHWAEKNTLLFINAANEGGSPQERMAILNQRVLEADQSVEAAIRSWSYYHPLVAEELAKVDQLRMDFLRDIFIQMDFPPEKALALAELEYAVLVGVQQLFPKASKEEMQKRFEFYAAHHWLNP